MAGRVSGGGNSSGGSDGERDYVELRFRTPRGSDSDDLDVVEAFTGVSRDVRDATASPGAGSGRTVRLTRLTDDLEMLRSEVTALRLMWSAAVGVRGEQATAGDAAASRARRAAAADGASVSPSPRHRLPTGDRVRLLAGAQGSAALPPRPAASGEKPSVGLPAAEAPAAPAPQPQPRVLDMRVPALRRRAPGEGEAPLRLLRPGAGGETAEAEAAPPVPLSREAAQLKASFEAAVAATEARLRAALAEALRESTNLRLARAPHAAADAAAAAAHRDALALRDAATSAAKPAASSAPHSSGEEEAEEPRAVAEREDPFVPLWQWAGGRPARLADLYRDAEAAGAEALPRSRLAALVATLAPAADARALRYVAAVLDADGAGDAVPLATFVHAVREGASAGAAARADAHAGLERCLSLVRRSLDAQHEAWAFQFRCAPGGALTSAQLLAAACAVLPELTPRQRVLFAAAAYAEGSFGGPRGSWTLPQLMILCAPRAQRSRRAAAMSAAAPPPLPPKPTAPAPPAAPPVPEEAPARAQQTEPPPERLLMARKKRASAEAAALAAMAAAAAAKAAAGVVREELQRAQAAREAAALEEPPPPLPPPLREGTRAELAAAEEAAPSAAPHAAAVAEDYALPPMQAHEAPPPPPAAKAAESSDAQGYSSTDASFTGSPARAAEPAHAALPAPAADAAVAKQSDAERAKRSAARARALLKQMQAALGAAAADADALRVAIHSNYELLASTRTQLCAPPAQPRFVQATWRR